MATTAAVEAAAPALVNRARGQQSSRPRALFAATVIGAVTAVAMYKLLRSGSPSEDDADQ
jgi:hypothetical protein